MTLVEEKLYFRVNFFKCFLDTGRTCWGSGEGFFKLLNSYIKIGYCFCSLIFIIVFYSKILKSISSRRMICWGSVEGFLVPLNSYVETGHQMVYKIENNEIDSI